jgi:adenosine deaminase/aminodeoxyfutalosine deaminase
MSRDSQDISEYIRRLPKAELHLHLEGTIEPATLAELSERVDAGSGAAPLTLAEAEALYQYTDFSGFMLAFKAVTRRLRGADEYELAAYRMIEQLAAQGVVHAEVYISVGVVYYWRKEEDAADPLLFEKIFAGLERARERGERDFGLTLYWIFDAVRHFSVPEAERVFRMAARMRREYPSIIGIGLGGDERVAASEPFREMYAEAAAAGLRLTNHAGETTGPEAIWEALAIGSERLGHALSAIRDEELVAELNRRQIPLELNPSSNVRTGSLCKRLLRVNLSRGNRGPCLRGRGIRARHQRLFVCSCPGHFQGCARDNPLFQRAFPKCCNRRQHEAGRVTDRVLRLVRPGGQGGANGV